MNRRLVALMAVLLLAASSCGGSKSKRTVATTSSSTSSTSSTVAETTTSTAAATTTTKKAAVTTRATSATTAPAAALASVRAKLTPVGSLDQPVAMAVHPGDSAIFVAERTGKVRALAGGGVALDVTALITSSGQEQGLLGLTFSSDGSHLYVNYTDRNGDTNVVEYGFAGGSANAASARTLLVIHQPYANHNGGNVILGPDNKLWIGMGDGGSANDPQNNAQDLNSLLGKMLRIDPAPSPGLAYTVPSDNPFVGRSGAHGEIWAYGLRNPWRFSFDRSTNDLWIGDVGQNAWEEVDWRPASSHGSENYGWRPLEGTHATGTGGDPVPTGATMPVEEYSHGGGACSVTGGYVYRGTKIPGLAGAYIYADFCVGHILALRLSDGRVTERRDLGMTLGNLSSFGQDASGELYALSLNGNVDRIDPA